MSGALEALRGVDALLSVGLAAARDESRPS